MLGWAAACEELVPIQRLVQLVRVDYIVPLGLANLGWEIWGDAGVKPGQSRAWAQ